MNRRFVRTTVYGREREMNRTDEALIAATLPTYVNAFAQTSRDTHYSTHTARTWTRKGRIDSDDTRPEIHRNVSPLRRFESTVTLAKITNMARGSFNYPQVSIANINNRKEMILRKHKPGNISSFQFKNLWRRRTGRQNPAWMTRNPSQNSYFCILRRKMTRWQRGFREFDSKTRKTNWKIRDTRDVNAQRLLRPHREQRLIVQRQGIARPSFPEYGSISIKCIHI